MRQKGCERRVIGHLRKPLRRPPWSRRAATRAGSVSCCWPTTSVSLEEGPNRTDEGLHCPASRLPADGTPPAPAGGRTSCQPPPVASPRVKGFAEVMRSTGLGRREVINLVRVGVLKEALGGPSGCQIATASLESWLARYADEPGAELPAASFPQVKPQFRPTA